MISVKQEPFRTARIKQGFTLTSLAQKAGVTRKHLSLIENGHASPGPELAKKLTTILNTEYDSIWVVQ
ncbi:helix-turn-helix domain-containing protein [Pelotomaculum propionicicum]|uniref:HTH cro/C1-type domain-containing protein n=1 Tax=Pelotomaculum propionicicum TaxID=258475 RepID=A0A4Y7RYK6_9FIRM|nr:helix-turn-helix transcriptional regulator [Pelotomaculum propionicicum]TEB13397.1 hypothetical protein Pmgp_00291 [Pelotomaculum propionicicum]